MPNAVAAVIFDLDGTLVDSLPGITASVQAVVEECFPGRKVPDLDRFIGPPIGVMIKQLWPELSDGELQLAITSFRRHYDTEGYLLSRLFSGVDETLATLHYAGLQLFVLTNKPALPTLAILDAKGIKARFTAVVSPDSSEPPFKCKNAAAVALQARHSLECERTVLVGDGRDDHDAAAYCGFEFIAAAYGYGQAFTLQNPRPVAALKTFSDIVSHVL